jgi:hypothetical protein
MTQRAERAGVYSDKRKLSKYESSLESAYKQLRVYTTSADEVATLTYVPDAVVVPDGTNATTAITLPTGYFEEDKQVKVVNKDTAETVDVGGVTCAFASLSVLYFNGTAWTLLYEQSGVTTS